MTTMQIWRERARANVRAYVTPRLPEIQSSKRKLRLRRGMGERALRSKPDSARGNYCARLLLHVLPNGPRCFLMRVNGFHGYRATGVLPPPPLSKQFAFGVVFLLSYIQVCPCVPSRQLSSDPIRRERLLT